MTAFFAKFHIHLPKWVAAWAAAIGGSVVDTVAVALSTPGYDPLSLLAWKTLGILAIKAIVIKTALWLLGLARGSTPPATAVAVLALVLAPLAWSCSPAPANGATITVLSAGDTAKIYAHWTPVNRATSYTYTVSTLATNGTWSGLPVSVSTPTSSISSFPTTANGDTAVFQLCVNAVGASGSSAVGCTSTTANSANTWHRKLGTPLPLMDSVTAFMLVPSRVTVMVGSNLTGVLCPFFGMGNGAWGMRALDAPGCTHLYDSAYTSAQRALSSVQQAKVNGLCVVWHNPHPEIVALTLSPVGCDTLA